MSNFIKYAAVALIGLLAIGCTGLISRGPNAPAPGRTDPGNTLDVRIAYGQYPRPVKHGEEAVFCAMWSNMEAPAYISVEYNLVADGQVVEQYTSPPVLVAAGKQGSKCTAPVVVDTTLNYTWTVTVNRGLKANEWVQPAEQRELQLCHTATDSCGIWTQPAEPY